MDRETKARLYVADDLAAGAALRLARPQAHYVSHVLRLRPGDGLALFNGRDGEWRADVEGVERGACALRLRERIRPQAPAADLWLVFAPVKRARIDYMAAKATELGVSAIWPVMTARTNVSRVNVRRLRENAIEAAEQCGRIEIPEIRAPVGFDRVLAAWPGGRRILLCDGAGDAPGIGRALADAAGAGGRPWAVLVGPEGGFSPAELDALAELPSVARAGLGPRTLRADTAAVAALACWQAFRGDWRRPPGRPERLR